MKESVLDSPPGNTPKSPLEKPATVMSNTVLVPKPASSLRLLNLSEGRQAMLHYFDNTWALTETLFSALTSEEAYYLRPYHKTRHPLIFYFCHPVTFYVNKLIVAGLLEGPVNRHFEFLFETGVDEMSWDDLHEGDQTVWPPLAEVVAYRKQVYDIVRNLILTHPGLDQPITMDSPGWALAMCFEHERIHLETSSVLMRELPIHHVHQPGNWPEVLLRKESQPNANPRAGIHYPADNPMIAVAARSVHLGKPRAWPSFGWDNEYGEETRDTAPFKANRYLISNGEFYQFIASGAYLDGKYWSEAGWAWRCFRNTRWPAFWVQDGPVGSHQYKLRTTFSIEDMQWDWPVVANFYEANAYCRWRSERDGVRAPYRLLREKEHIAIREPLRQQAGDWSIEQQHWLQLDRVMVDEAELESGYEVNNNLHFGSESPVDRFAANSLGFHDVFGNVWQWSQDAFHPLPGFRIHPYYVDFSTPCFDGEHQMILGGSFISTGDEASIWARFHFRPHFFQHAGFRMVQSDENGEMNRVDSGGVHDNQEKTRYETEALLNQYMLFHWGSEEEQRDQAISARLAHPPTKPFIRATVDLVERFTPGRNRVLDLGCAVGKASVELAKSFREVTGIDYSQSFIDAAKHLLQEGHLDYLRHESGRHYTRLTARLTPDVDRSRISFVRGDATQLRAIAAARKMDLGGFDAVLLSNLMCRLPDPAGCLRQFVDDEQLLQPGGILVLVSPNSWMNQYTPQENFLDGIDNDAALASIAAVLKGFELLHEEDLPFMIREHRRKYEYVVSQVSVWRKG